MTGPRRYIVKEVTSSPGWTGTVWGVGCNSLKSAEALFERKADKSGSDWADGYSALLLIDRVERKVVRALESDGPAKTARFFGEDVD